MRKMITIKLDADGEVSFETSARFSKLTPDQQADIMCEAWHQMATGSGSDIDAAIQWSQAEIRRLHRCLRATKGKTMADEPIAMPTSFRLEWAAR